MLPPDKKKRQAVLAGCLFAVVIALAIWDFSGPSAPAASQPMRARVETSSLQHPASRKGPAAAHPSSFRLQLDRLARSEGVDYENDGRSLFGGPPPAAIETPVAPPRPVAVAAPVAPVAAKPEPSIDIRYAGFAESGSGNMNGLFMHGDDISVARAGDIIFHRFRVGSIQSTTAQITDLVSNRSQRVIAAGAK